MKIRSPPANLRQRITDHFLTAFLNMQLAITESLLRASQGRWLLTRIFFCKVCWLTPFNMYFDFRPLLRRTFANIREHIPIHRPRPSAGGVLKEKGTPGALVIGSRKASLLETWLLRLELVFSRLQKASLGSDSGRCKDVLQDHGAWLSRSLTFGSSAASYEGQGDCPISTTTQGTEPEPNRNSLVPFSCRSPGGSVVAALYIMIIISNFRETFATTNVTFANSKKTFARVSNITCTAFAIKTPYQDL